MVKGSLNFLGVLVLTMMLAACAGEKMQLEVKAHMDGQPAAQASVTVDGVAEGMTGADGVFTKMLTKKPGADVEIVVSKEQPGYRITPWKTSFVMKLPKKGVVEKYPFDADLEAVHFVTIAATENGGPVAEATVRVGSQEVGKTDAKGEFVYEYRELPKGSVDFSVTKPGFSTWRKTGTVEPGQRFEALLAKRARVTVVALTEEYGQTGGIAGLAVSIDRRQVGRTDAKGMMNYSYDGEPGKKVQAMISAPDFVPSSWKTTVALEGEITLQHYFTSKIAKPIRTGIYRFIGNTPNVDLRDITARTEEALARQLFKYSCFREVPSKTLQAEIKASRANIDRITTKGWRGTRLKKVVDMIVLGSVAKDDQGYMIETKFITSGGKLIHSQLARAPREKDLEDAAKEIARSVLATFPFEGTVTAIDDAQVKINLGKSGYRIGKNMEFSLLSPRTDESGKVTAYRDVGRLRVKKVDDAFSLTEVENMKKGEKAQPGDRVVRIAVREGEEEKNFAVIDTKGGIPPDLSPLGGVNIYVNDAWVTTTGPDGKAEIPLRLGQRYDITLYRHGYQQVSEKLRITKNQEVRDFTLVVNNAIFKVDSVPSNAEVFVDGERIGKTPIIDGHAVSLGFHTVRIAAGGGEYRDWEEVVEFASKTEDRTGNRSIVLYKDYLRIGETDQQKGDVDGAISAYQSTEKGHPDYSEAHHRLAQLYLDEKNDYDGAIREFENVLSLPENEQLIYKQYAVAFTNLGHAYYERGNALVQTDRELAAQSFAKAIQALQKAKENTRFFPTAHYDEAVHDTYYYTALSYHKLYLLTRKQSLLNSANLAWQEYFDFFPKKLEGNGTFEQSREAGRKYWDQIRDQR